ncbi:MAG: hypothetical protein ACOCRK_01710 [bacterium]
MKRLIRKSEFYEGFYDYSKEYCEIFINPTSDEINVIKNNNKYKSLRGVIYSDGTILIWPGTVLHDDVDGYTEKHINVDDDSFRFACEEGRGWIIDGHGEFTGKELAEKIKEYEQILKKMGNMDEMFHLWNMKDFEHIIVSFNFIDDDIERHYKKYKIAKK